MHILKKNISGTRIFIVDSHSTLLEYVLTNIKSIRIRFGINLEVLLEDRVTPFWLQNNAILYFEFKASINWLKKLLRLIIPVNYKIDQNLHRLKRKKNKKKTKFKVF